MMLPDMSVERLQVHRLCSRTDVGISKPKVGFANLLDVLQGGRGILLQQILEIALIDLSGSDESIIG